MFKTGDKVVCIDDLGAENLVKDEVYTVKDCWDDGRGGALLLFEAQPNLGHIAFYPNRFRKTEDNWVEELIEKISVREEIEECS